MGYIIRVVLGDSSRGAIQALEYVEAEASRRGLSVTRSPHCLEVEGGARRITEQFVDDPSVNPERCTIYMEADEPALGSCP